MGTRGFVGFVVDGNEKITYNHSDSYPGGLGLDVLTWLRQHGVSEVREAAAKLRLVNNDEPATDEDIACLGTKYADTNVSTRELTEWYVLLRGTQGNPEAILDAGVMIDGSDFPCNSAMCEYGYLIDLDENTFEVYVGFQRDRHGDGRFANDTANSGGYYPVRLVATWFLDNLPTDDEFAIELEHQ